MESQPIRIAVKKLERQLAGETMAVGERTLEPKARMAGWYGGDANERAGGAWGLLRVTPVEVIVHEPDGREQRVEIVDATAAALRGLTALSLLVMLVSWLVILFARRNRRKEGAEGGGQ